MKPHFRVWDIKNKLMLDLRLINFEESYIEVCDGDWYGFEQVALMQSTGLKDKYGVEIYEGDIVSELSEQGEDWANHILVEVVWHKVGFYGKEKGHEPEYPITEFVKGEVIGNIYENSNLIK